MCRVAGKSGRNIKRPAGRPDKGSSGWHLASPALAPDDVGYGNQGDNQHIEQHRAERELAFRVGGSCDRNGDGGVARRRREREYLAVPGVRTLTRINQSL